MAFDLLNQGTGNAVDIDWLTVGDAPLANVSEPFRIMKFELSLIHI